MSFKLIKEKLNKFGSKKEPFLFVISYDLSKFYIEKISELQTSVKYEFNTKKNQKTKNNWRSYKTIKFQIPTNKFGIWNFLFFGIF